MIIINEGKLKSFPLRASGVIIQIPPGESDHPDSPELAKYVASHPDLSLGSVDEPVAPKPAPVEEAPEPKKRKRKPKTEPEEKSEPEPSDDSGDVEPLDE